MFRLLMLMFGVPLGFPRVRGDVPSTDTRSVT